MEEQILRHIDEYVNYLNTATELKVSICGIDFSIRPRLNILANYNAHRNKFCAHLKWNNSMLRKCQNHQEKVRRKCFEGAFFGMCYAGVEEYVFPIKYKGETYGFISVSGYRINEQKGRIRIHHLCQKFGLDEGDILQRYEQDLSVDLPNMKYLNTLINPLNDMFTLLLIQIEENREGHLRELTQKDIIYNRIVLYISENYHNKITAEDISAHCHYSVSYISRLFNEINGCGISLYIMKFRLKEGRRLLANTELSVQEISNQIGFTDSNYFSNSFKREYGLSPRAYRRAGPHRPIAPRTLL